MNKKRVPMDAGRECDLFRCSRSAARWLGWPLEIDKDDLLADFVCCADRLFSSSESTNDPAPSIG